MMLDKLDKRKKIILGAVAAAFVVTIGYAALAPAPKRGHGGHKGGGNTPAGDRADKGSAKGNNKVATYEQAKKKARAKLNRAESMTEEQYAKLKEHNKNVPYTLKEFIERQRNALTKLETMTKNEWEASKKNNKRSGGKGEGNGKGGDAAQGKGGDDADLGMPDDDMDAKPAASEKKADAKADAKKTIDDDMGDDE